MIDEAFACCRAIIERVDALGVYVACDRMVLRGSSRRLSPVLLSQHGSHCISIDIHRANNTDMTVSARLI